MLNLITDCVRVSIAMQMDHFFPILISLHSFILRRFFCLPFVVPNIRMQTSYAKRKSLWPGLWDCRAEEKLPFRPLAAAAAATEICVGPTFLFAAFLRSDIFGEIDFLSFFPEFSFLNYLWQDKFFFLFTIFYYIFINFQYRRYRLDQ